MKFVEILQEMSTGAGDAHARALEIYREIGNRNGEAIAMAELGRVRHQIGDHSGGREAHAQALEIFRETGARGNEAWALNRYAAAVAPTGDRRPATGDRPRALAEPLPPCRRRCALWMPNAPDVHRARAGTPP